MTIAVIGAKGMLGSDLSTLLKTRGVSFKELDIDEIDITKKESVRTILSEIEPKIIINCAAYTNVDLAEDEQELAFRTNHIGTKNLAEYAGESNTLLCHISTDYVFDGKKREPYLEDDAVSPLGVYGASKLAGEEVVKKYVKYYIVRSAWLYGQNGKNFVKTIIDASQKRSQLRVVSDQVGNPTYTTDLAMRIMEIIDNDLPHGIYHATNSGITTWFELAVEALKIKGIQTEVVPITTEEHPTKVTRPKYSVLSNDKCTRAGLSEMPSWQDALKRFLK